MPDLERAAEHSSASILLRLRAMATDSRILVAAGAFFAACGGGGAGESPAPPGLIAVKRIDPIPICAKERAVVPDTRVSFLSATSANAQTQRTEQAPFYVSYQVQTDDLFVYFSFESSFPRADVTTETARKLLKYAYVHASFKQPAEVGGRLTLLSSSDLLHLEDFDRFEVEGGQLKWRLARSSGEHYIKVLSIYDADPTNDPKPVEACVSDDIVGICPCGFTGPAITVTVEGTTPLVL